MRQTIEIRDDAYQIAKTVARERKQSFGQVVSDFITGAFERPDSPEVSGIEEQFPTFRCQRRVTSEDVKAIEDE